MKFSIVKGDLFTVDKKYILAHCIASDCAMAAGIATQFVKRNPKMREVLKSMNPEITDVLYYSEEKDKVLNLITKSKSYEKTKRKDFNDTILNLKETMLNMNLKYLAIPLIGSGLDKLDWKVSEEYIKQVFSDTDIEILVYVL